MGNTPLHIAALMGRKDSLECLINFGADTTLLTQVSGNNIVYNNDMQSKIHSASTKILLS